MSYVVHDLICNNGHPIDNVRYRRSDGQPACHCGATTSTSWHSRRAPSIHGNGLMLYQGKQISTGAFNQIFRDEQAANPGKTLRLVEESDYDFKVNYDERGQETTDYRKWRGHDKQALVEDNTIKLEKDLHDTSQQSQKDWSTKVNAAAKKLSLYKKSHETSF